jgi:hypothetical protein
MIHDPQELAHRFNEDEGVWRSFEEKRFLRRLLGSPSPFSEEVLDALDWSEAQREARPTRAVGRWIDP